MIVFFPLQLLISYAKQWVAMLWLFFVLFLGGVYFKSQIDDARIFFASSFVVFRIYIVHSDRKINDDINFFFKSRWGIVFIGFDS